MFFLAELVNFFLRDLSLVTEVAFIANQKENSIFFSIGLHLIHPKFTDVLKAKLIRQIEHQEYALTASIVGTGDGSKPLLSSCVPDLEFDIFVINLDGLESEVDADGG